MQRNLEKNIKNLPEGMTSDEVRSMKDNEFLDIDYFFHKFDDTDNDDFCKKKQFPIIKKYRTNRMSVLHFICFL